MSTVHYLKTREPWYSRVVAEEKTAEIRVHDRDFQVGDSLVLVRTVRDVSVKAEDILDRDSEDTDTRAVVVEVTHVAPGRMIDGLNDTYCLLSTRFIGNYEHVPA